MNSMARILPAAFAAMAVMVVAKECQAQETYNIFGGSALRWSMPPDGANQSISWSLYDQDGNFRDFNMLWDGTLDIPGALQLDHQTMKHHGAWRWHWTSDDQGAPVLKGWPPRWPAGASVEMEVAPGVVYKFTAEGLVLPSGRVLR